MKRPNTDQGLHNGKRHKPSNNIPARKSNGSFNTPHKHDRQPRNNDPVQEFRSQPLKTLEILLQAIERNAAHCPAQDIIDHTRGLLKSLRALDAGSSNAALDLFQPSKDDHRRSVSVPPYYVAERLKLETSLPPLPQIPEHDSLHRAPFTHKSVVTSADRQLHTNNTSSHEPQDYERLEFLGDAYLEAMATRLVFSRYSHLPIGRQSQVRERLVKNETLCGFAKAYDFASRIAVTDNEKTANLAAGNKGFNKILADVFEAYIAAVILSDPENGFTRTETWLTQLWAPILLQHYGPESEITLGAANYNPNAKSELQNKLGVGIFDDEKVAIEYRDDKPVQPGQKTAASSRDAETPVSHHVGAYLTGWGYKKHLLGTGSGHSKTEAGMRAAMDAMEKSKLLVDELEQKCLVKKAERDAERQRRKLEKDAKRAAERAAAGGME